MLRSTAFNLIPCWSQNISSLLVNPCLLPELQTSASPDRFTGPLRRAPNSANSATWFKFAPVKSALAKSCPSPWVWGWFTPNATGGHRGSRCPGSQRTELKKKNQRTGWVENGELKAGRKPTKKTCPNWVWVENGDKRPSKSAVIFLLKAVVACAWMVVFSKSSHRNLQHRGSLKFRRQKICTSKSSESSDGSNLGAFGCSSIQPSTSNGVCHRLSGSNWTTRLNPTGMTGVECGDTGFAESFKRSPVP